MFGLSGEKIVILAVIAALVLGPERLPGYAKQLAKWAKSLKKFAEGAKDQLADELGEDYQDLDWKKLDPRQYDPRRIIREALLEDDDAKPRGVNAAAVAAGAAGVAASAGSSALPKPVLAAGEAAPFDAEAT